MPAYRILSGKNVIATVRSFDSAREVAFEKANSLSRQMRVEVFQGNGRWSQVSFITSNGSEISLPNSPRKMQPFNGRNSMFGSQSSTQRTGNAFLEPEKDAPVKSSRKGGFS